MNLRLVKLPPRLEMILYLISEELKVTKVFKALSSAGLDDSYYQPYFGAIVLTYVGFEERDDDIINFYQELLDKSCEKIEADNVTITELAFEIYVDLEMERKNRLSEEE